MPKQAQDDDRPKEYSRRQALKMLFDIEKAAFQARNAIMAGRNCFPHVEDIHAAANDLHWSMDEGITHTIFPKK